MANRNRKHKITLYLSDDEMYILKNKAQLSNLGSMSAYLRNLIIYGYVYDVDYKFLHDYSVELSLIGNLINQIAKRANATGNLYLEDMKEVKELMEKIWHTHESMLSRQLLISRSLHLQSG
ncbi:plasmid mobilization protein [Eubacterium ventriosum]|uniref:plasmid mobilization protein n=1 Tax=Eubacterium ventriosum TaxID=39496 RepID=UPI001C0171CB|nr:plasmid mobilization relaxosome protein MobC [Eubacterium ventriosum]MBT9693677.1 plasmid mobilization relaxosome protein MobC [Eubacterium ventriosum]